MSALWKKLLHWPRWLVESWWVRGLRCWQGQKAGECPVAVLGWRWSFPP